MFSFHEFFGRPGVATRSLLIFLYLVNFASSLSICIVFHQKNLGLPAVKLANNYSLLLVCLVSSQISPTKIFSISAQRLSPRRSLSLAVLPSVHPIFNGIILKMKLRNETRQNFEDQFNCCNHHMMANAAQRMKLHKICPVIRLSPMRRRGVEQRQCLKGLLVP
jgi:hypothetical protein